MMKEQNLKTNSLFNNRFLFMVLFSIFMFALSVSSADAVNCWEGDFSDQTTCESQGTGDECSWDEWGNYCMEKGCWDYWDQASCNLANETGCFWKTGGDMFADSGWCEEAVACWNYWTETPCTNVSGCLWKSSSCQGPPGCSDYASQSTCDDAGIGCWWDSGNYCYKPGAWDYKTKASCQAASYTWNSNSYCQEAGGNCWDYNAQGTCEGATGCEWESTGGTDGWCYKKGCWEYPDNGSCSGVETCMWNGDLSTGWCTEKECWNYWENTTCLADAKGIGNCEWQTSGNCQNPACSDYSSTNSTECNSKTGCIWDNSSSLCNWKGCWNYENETVCDATSGCLWDSSYNYCSERNCWTYDNTNQTGCEDDTDAYNLDCEWNSNNQWCNQKWCGSYTNETLCNNSASGKCYWENGWCMEESCWGYDETNCDSKGCSWNSGWGYCQESASSDCYSIALEADCTNSTNNATCRWDLWSNSCMNKGCWDLTTNASCQNANLSATCEWTEESGGWCEETGAQCWDYYIQNDCETNDCVWDSTWNNCYEKGCWSYWDNDTCVGDSNLNCDWKTQSSAGWGWCEKRSCWNYDDTNASACQNNTFNLTCTWETANAGDGFCFGSWDKNCWQYEKWNGGNGSTGCEGAGCTWENKSGFCFEDYKGLSDFTTEGDCMKSGWGIWNGSDCLEPTDGISFEGINPGCWLFDGLSSNCTGIKGCTYNSTTEECDGLDTGMQCGNITSQDMCEKLPMLSTCCKWTGNSCDTTYDTTCWDQMAELPEGATHCMDYNSIDSPTLCNQIAGDPWYMPCKWNNISSQCEFKGDMATNVDDVKTKKNCEFLGGVWKSETICDDNGTIDTSDDMPKTNSWCEMGAGSSLYGCDVSCFACNTTTSCSASKKGYCSWVADANHPQGGFCDIPKDLERNGDCDRFCGSCEYYSGGDSTPKKACKSSKAKCKWDNATSTCISKNDMGCVDDCFSCMDKNDCTLNGGGSQGTCKWDDINNMCQPANFDGEVCFDAIDNDQNDLIDCNDPACMFDSFCGGGSMGDCWNYFDSTSCASASEGCIWFQDPWTQNYRCGMKGENCWTFDQNQTGCNVDTNCQWFNENFCEINHTKAGTCFNYNSKTSCQSNTECKWKEDQFSPQGGWCDFGVFECHWNSTKQQSKTKCEQGGLCVWNLDPWTNIGMCEPKCFSRDSVGNPTYTTETGCNNAIAGGLCQWSSGWCEPNSTSVGAVKGGDCAQYDNNMGDCEQQPGCAWFTDFMTGPGGSNDGSGAGGMGGSNCEVKYSAIDCHDYNNETVCDIINKNGTYQIGVEGNACRWVTEGSWSWCDPIGMHCGPKYAPFNSSTNQPQLNSSGCDADPYCIVFNDTYMGSQICMPVCMNSSLNISTCQAAGDGNTCAWTGSGGGAGECDYSYCDTTCSACPDANTTICPVDCATKCQGCHDVGGGTGEGGEFGGWCDPVGMKVIFEAMEGGKPHEIAFDTCGESGIPEWADACFAGIKEMPDDYGFGIGLKSMTYAAACNGETLWDGSTGSGRKTTKGFIYLDTDGNETNNCASDDSAQQGFEFKFIAEWGWSNDGLEQTLTAKRCLNSSWATSKLALGTHTKKMCTELQGMVITVKKADLTNFPKLFKPQYPMRIYALTANSTSTASNPSDSLGPGYYQSGGTDFKMEDCNAIGNIDIDNDGFYAYEDPDCKYIYMNNDKGFKTSEDCTTAYDDDMDGLTNCDDSECKDEIICGGTLAVDSTDHTPPGIKEKTVDAFLTKAVVTYKTDERANGTLSFYYNDNTCTTLNASLRDKGLWDSSNELRKKYKFTHKGFVDNLDYTDKLTYTLNNNTAYYYKLKVCDISNNCKISGCLNFTTRSTAKESTIKITDPDSGQGWQIDKGTGSYSDVGGGCVAAGSSTNSNLGDIVDPEQVNEIGLKTNSTSTSGDEMVLEFGGVSTSGDIVSDADVDTGSVTGPGGDTEDYFWMNESGWSGDSGLLTQGTPDNMTLVFPGNDTELWDCESSSSGTLAGCTNITGYATRSYDGSANSTTWIIYNPGADLWSYIVDQSPSTSSGDDGGSGDTGGSGGGGGGATPTSTVSKTQKWQVFPTGYTKMTIAKSDLGFESINIYSNKKLNNVEITVKKLNSKPDTVTEPLNKLYHYVEIIESVIKDEDVDEVNIEVKVEKEWILNYSIDEDTVVVNRWNNNKWNSLSTTKTSSDETYVYYDATSPGLSYFAITANEVDAVVQEEVLDTEIENITTTEDKEAEPITAEVTKDVEIGKDEEKKSFTKTLLIVVLPIIVISAVILGYVFYINKKKEEESEEETSEEEPEEEAPKEEAQGEALEEESTEEKSI